MTRLRRPYSRAAIAKALWKAWEKIKRDRRVHFLGSWPTPVDRSSWKPGEGCIGQRAGTLVGARGYPGSTATTMYWAGDHRAALGSVIYAYDMLVGDGDTRKVVAAIKKFERGPTQ